MFLKQSKIRKFNVLPRSYSKLEEEKQANGKRFNFQATRRFQFHEKGEDNYKEQAKRKLKLYVAGVLICSFLLYYFRH